MVTTRDTVWSTVLKLGYEDQKNGDRLDGFTVKDILAESGLDDSQRRTVVRTLRAMEELGHVSHKENSPVYRFRGTVEFDRAMHWSRSREDERRLRKLAMEMGYRDGLPFAMILDALEDRLKDEAVERWRSEIEAESA